MGLLDTFRSVGRPKAEPEENTSGFLGTDIQPTVSESNFIPERTLSSDSGVTDFATSSEPEGGRLYNPYEGLNTAIDPRVLRNVYKLPQQPEFLFSEEATVHRRSWSENLTYYTGSGYLTGALFGGARGALEAVRTSPVANVDSARLRLNRLLNVAGRSGRSAGNALGILGLFFSSGESGISYLSEGRTPDAANSLAAGFVTGALFRSTRGPRAAAVAGVVGATAAGMLIGARNTFARGL